MCSLRIIGSFPSLMDLENRSASDSSMKGAPSLRRRPGMESGPLDLVGSILYNSLKALSAEMETEVIELRLYGSWTLRSARALVSPLVNIKQKKLLKVPALSTSQFSTWPRCTISGMMLFGALVFFIHHQRNLAFLVIRVTEDMWSFLVCCRTQLLIPRYRVQGRSNFVFLISPSFLLDKLPGVYS